MSEKRPQSLRFNGGEMDKHMLARRDTEVYAKGCETAENVFPLLQGGVTRPPGTRHIAPSIAASTKDAVLEPFIYGDDQAYALELTAGRARFLFNGGVAQVEGGVGVFGAWTDASAAPSGGGAPPPDGGATPIGGGGESGGGGAGGTGGGFQGGGGFTGGFAVDPRFFNIDFTDFKVII
jgi:hypothetical protein